MSGAVDEEEEEEEGGPGDAAACAASVWSRYDGTAIKR